MTEKKPLSPTQTTSAPHDSEISGSPNTLKEIISRVSEIAIEFLDQERSLPGGSLRDPGQLARDLELTLGENGIEPGAVMERLRAVLRATPSSSSWRFVNQLFGGREPLGTAAEMLTAIPNVSMYTFKAAGAQILVETEVLRRMVAIAGFPDGEACFTPGGTLANVVAMLLARNRIEPGSRDDGKSGRKLGIYASVESHYSIMRAAGLLGIGRNQVRKIATDDAGRMDPVALTLAIKADRAAGVAPAIVVATSGTTVRGAFDPLRAIAPIAREAGAWMHVDGAFGGSLLMSSSHRGMLDGIELADSFSWDPHKMMGVTLQCSVLVTARRGELARSLNESADYLFQADDDDLNPGHRSLLCGRRNDALKLWAAWLHLGDAGWRERIDRQMAVAATAVQMITGDNDLLLAERPQTINVCFELKDRSSEAICDLLDREGRIKIGHGIVRGRRVIRLVCVNPDLGKRHLAWILQQIKEAGAALPPGDNAIRTL